MVKENFQVRIPPKIAEKVRDIVYWTPGLTISSFTQDALRNHIGQYEQQRIAPYPERRNHKPQRMNND